MAETVLVKFLLSSKFLIPATIAAGTAVSTTMTIQGQRQQAAAAQAQEETEEAILRQNAEAQRAIAEYNAQMAEREAEAERVAARREAEKFEKEGRRLKGTQRVLLARGGVLATEGTPALLLDETAQELEQERLDILKEGFRRSEYLESQAAGLRFGGESEARSLRYQGAAARARGANLARGYKLASRGQYGTLLTSAGQIAYTRHRLKKGY